MIQDLLFPLEMRVVETMREPDGLALSSRNRYLSFEERNRAPALYRGLVKGKECLQNGIKDAQTIKELCQEEILKTSGIEIEYLSIADPTDLSELKLIEKSAIFSGAIKVGKTRIIDNVVLNMSVADLGFSLQ
jgi:pantoate--beta-alanine ligase